MSVSATLKSKKRALSRMNDMGLNLEQIPSLKDRLVSYQIAAATFRKETDALIALWRDIIHGYLMEVGYGDPHRLHAVLDSMDEVLRRSK